MTSEESAKRSLEALPDDLMAARASAHKLRGTINLRSPGRGVRAEVSVFPGLTCAIKAVMAFAMAASSKVAATNVLLRAAPKNGAPSPSQVLLSNTPYTARAYVRR